VLQIDGYVDLADLSLEFVEEMERLAPFGAGNPPLTLATRKLSLKGHTTVGRLGEHLKITVEDDEGVTQPVLWWRAEESALPQGPFDLAYAVRASDYRGQRDVQLEWIDARPIERPEAARRLERAAIEVIDHRHASDPRSELDRLQAETDVLVWNEGKTPVQGQDRYGLVPSRSLAIWTTPPGSAELRAALAQVSPTIVYLFAVDPGLDRPESFLTHLARLAKQAITKKNGGVELSVLAAATAQREETVRTGLAWLEAQGHVIVLEERRDMIHLAPGDGSTTDDSSKTAERLRALLEETGAYRAHVARADANALINNALLD
jgi:single-stranded-DNA-specific exonuclease